MKRIFVLWLLFVFSLPALAWNETAARKSLDYLNASVESKVPEFMEILDNDLAQINAIITLYKKNPEAIKTKKINDFGKACVSRSQQLLKTYDNYFLAAYKVYTNFDRSLTYDEWVNSVGISEISKFYEFYGLTEANLEDCQKIVERSTNH